MSSARAVRQALLPPSLPPRGLSREESATYIGVSPTTFDKMVDDGRMPKPKNINERKIWDRHKLDSSFAALPDTDGHNDAEQRWGHFAV